jgi:hypothetical protein
MMERKEFEVELRVGVENASEKLCWVGEEGEGPEIPTDPRQRTFQRT